MESLDILNIFSVLLSSGAVVIILNGQRKAVKEKNNLRVEAQKLRAKINNG